jgi:tetratricopeptide (TPR) repeat protein
LAAAWAVRGAAFFALGDLRSALADLDRAAELSPDESVLFNRGSVSLALGRLAEAERDFSEVVALSPDDPDGWQRRAECREAAGDLSGARADRARSARLAGMVAG